MLIGVFRYRQHLPWHLNTSTHFSNLHNTMSTLGILTHQHNVNTWHNSTRPILAIWTRKHNGSICHLSTPTQCQHLARCVRMMPVVDIALACSNTKCWCGLGVFKHQVLPLCWHVQMPSVELCWCVDVLYRSCWLLIDIINFPCLWYFFFRMEVRFLSDPWSWVPTKIEGA
jgi:hypothetical protein